MKKKDVTPGEALSIRVGDFVENSIEKQPGYGIMTLASRFRALIG